MIIKNVSGLRPSAAVDNIIDCLAVTLDDLEALGGEADFYAPTRLFARLLLAPTAEPSDVDAVRLRELGRLDVPRLDELDWRDLVSIRRNDDAFELWRLH